MIYDHASSNLLDNSWLRWDAANKRYSIHELLRQYAEEQLAQDEQALLQTQDLYVNYYMELLEEHEITLHGHRQRETIQLLEHERDNIRAAWRCAVHQGNISSIYRGAHAYYDLNDLRGRYQEVVDATAPAIKMLESAVTGEARDLALAVVYNAAGGIHVRLGRFDEAASAYNRSRDLFRQSGRRPHSGFGTDPLIGLGLLATTIGNHEDAVAYATVALDLADPQEDQLNIMFAKYVLASANYSLGQSETALTYARQAHQISETLGDKWFGSYILIVMGDIAAVMRDFDQAWQYYHASYEFKEQFDDLVGMAFALNCMAQIAWFRRDYQEATSLYTQAKDLYNEMNDPGGLATSYFGLGNTAQADGDYAASREHFVKALEIATKIHWSPLILQIFAGVADLLLRTSNNAQAVELLVWCAGHPANDSSTQLRAEKLLARAKPRVSADTLKAANLQIEKIDMETLAQSLLAQLKQKLDPPAPDPQQVANEALPDPLTAREFEVLRFLVKRRTNREIADTLVISLGTVKTHAHNIYSKLSVNNRRQAARRAQELHLI